MNYLIIKIKIIEIYKVLIKIFLFLFLFSLLKEVQLKILNHNIEINLIIKGKNTDQLILSQIFFDLNKPSKIIINGTNQNYIRSKYYLENQIYNISIIWENSINNYSYIFENLFKK